jgi:hypothetical protein
VELPDSRGSERVDGRERGFRCGRRPVVRGLAIGSHLASASVESSGRAAATAFHATGQRESGLLLFVQPSSERTLDPVRRDNSFPRSRSLTLRACWSSQARADAHPACALVSTRDSDRRVRAYHREPFLPSFGLVAGRAPAERDAGCQHRCAQAASSALRPCSPASVDSGASRAARRRRGTVGGRDRPRTTPGGTRSLRGGSRNVSGSTG